MYCTHNLKFTCFVLFLKIFQHLFYKMIYAAYRKLSKELKNNIKFLKF